jgi:hypothetical protein
MNSTYDSLSPMEREEWARKPKKRVIDCYCDEVRKQDPKKMCKSCERKTKTYMEGR